MNKLINGLPSLLGVIAGVQLYTSDDNCGWLIIALIFLIVFVSMLIGKWITPKHPRAGMLLIEIWILSPICLVAASTAFIVWLSIHSPTWFNVPQDQLKVITGVFIGAITTYFASAWTNDISKGDGYFWPTKQLKEAFLKFKLTGDNKLVDAATADRVRDAGPQGWGIKSRWQRASILSDSLKQDD